MAKGQAMRRRAKNFLEAKVGIAAFRDCILCHRRADFTRSDMVNMQETKSGRLRSLPPPPDAVAKRGKRNADVPRSLQRMLELKVGCLSCGKDIQLTFRGLNNSASSNVIELAREGLEQQQVSLG